MAGPVGKEAEFRLFLAHLAEQMTMSQGNKFTGSGLGLQFKLAVSQQVKWSGKRSGDSLSSQVFVNKAAAYDAGFIRLHDMPVEMVLFYGKRAA